MRIKAKTPAKKVVTLTSTATKSLVRDTVKRTTPKTRRISFSVHAEIGSRVFLAGSFNKWNPSAKPMMDKKGIGLFTASLALAPGTYEYKFIIDGTWCADPECVDWVQNDHGTLNSVIRVD